MIYDVLQDIKIYKGMNKNLDRAIDFISEKKYLDAKPGENIIEKNVIYFNFCEKVMTRENDNLEFECHKKYIDIHIVLEGEETIAYAKFKDCVETQSYDPEKDTAFMKGKIQAKLVLNKDNFLIFFPKEPHLPLLKVNEIKEIKKIIFKIEV